MSRLDPETWSTAPRYPARPGHVRGSATSRDAAQSISDKVLGDLHRRVWKHLRDCGGCTDEQGMAALGINPSTYRPRRVELTLQGWVRDSGRRAPTESGRQAIVWEAVR